MGLDAALGIAFGVALGFGLAQFVQAPAPAPAVAAVKSIAQAPRPAAIPVAANTTVTAPAVMAPNDPAPGAPAPRPAAVGAQPATTSTGPAAVAASVAARTEAGRELLASAPGTRFSVQLMVTDANSREYLETWLADAGRAVEPGMLYLVPAGGADAPRVGVLFGSYAERGQASEALAALPPSLRQFRPYVRSLDAVREDARRTPGR